MENNKEEAVLSQSSNQTSYFRRPWAIAGAITIGIIASGFYDLLIKPGISRFGDWIFNLIASWSVTIQNAPYSTAALDPTPLASLIIIILLSALPTLALFILLTLIITKKLRNKFQESLSQKSEKKIDSYKMKFIIFSFLYIITIILIVQTGTSILNKSVIIYRVFHANLKICKPYISEHEEKVFLSKFASIETRNDYVNLHRELVQIATKNKIFLRKEVIE